MQSSRRSLVSKVSQPVSHRDLLQAWGFLIQEAEDTPDFPEHQSKESKLLPILYPVRELYSSLKIENPILSVKERL